MDAKSIIGATYFESGFRKVLEGSLYHKLSGILRIICIKHNEGSTRSATGTDKTDKTQDHHRMEIELWYILELVRAQAANPKARFSLPLMNE